MLPVTDYGIRKGFIWRVLDLDKGEAAGRSARVAKKKKKAPARKKR